MVENCQNESAHCHRILAIFFQWSTFRIIRLFQALQEFCELCSKEDNIEVVKTSEAGMLLIMPYWPRLYMRLSNDQDRRVREMAQKAHWVGKYTLWHFLYWSRLPIIFLRLIPKLCWLTKSRLRHSIWKSAKKKMSHVNFHIETVSKIDFWRNIQISLVCKL